MEGIRKILKSTAAILQMDISEFDTWTPFFVKLGPLQQLNCQLRLT